MKSVRTILAAALLFFPIAACGDAKKPAENAVQEAKVDEARLKEFATFLPAAPRGFTASEAVATTGDTMSVIRKVYTAPQGDSFSLEIIFSNAEVAKYQKLVDEPKDAARAGAEVNQVGGRDGLTFGAYTMGKPLYVMICSPSRFISATPIFGDTTKPVMRAVFEQIDFGGIGTKP